MPNLTGLHGRPLYGRGLDHPLSVALLRPSLRCSVRSPSDPRRGALQVSRDGGTAQAASIDDWRLHQGRVQLGLGVSTGVQAHQTLTTARLPRWRTMGPPRWAVHRHEPGAVATGSWLGRQFQGRGVGKEMRAAALHLAFEGLGAEGAYSGGLRGQPDLPCRLALARLRGERCDHVHNREGERAGEVGLRLTRPAWEQRQRQDIEILGLDACRDWFGIASGGSSP